MLLIAGVPLPTSVVVLYIFKIYLCVVVIVRRSFFILLALIYQRVSLGLQAFRLCIWQLIEPLLTVGAAICLHQLYLFVFPLGRKRWRHLAQLVVLLAKVAVLGALLLLKILGAQAALRPIRFLFSIRLSSALVIA